ncbi:UNVERIFIED_CONTAM: hypothetical protein NCL1_16708 [Trichonephila clavipes]
MRKNFRTSSYKTYNKLTVISDEVVRFLIELILSEERSWRVERKFVNLKSKVILMLYALLPFDIFFPFVTYLKLEMF